MPNRRAWGTLNQRTGVVPPVDTPPNTLFGANLWAWYQPSGISHSSGTVSVWNDNGAATTRDLTAIGGTLSTTTINGVTAVNFLVASNHAMTATSLDPSINLSLAGKTQITVFAVASFRSPTEAFGGFLAYGSTNTANAYDAGSAWLGALRNNTNDEITGASTGSFTAATPGETPFYRFCTVWDGTNSKFYINNVLQATSAAFTAALTGAGPPTGTERLMLGAAIAGGSHSFKWDGKIGEVAIIVDTVPTDYQRGSYDLNLKNKFGL